MNENNYRLVKKYRIVRDYGSGIYDDGFSDKNTALNHIIYKLMDDIKSYKPDADKAEIRKMMNSDIRHWTIEEYYEIEPNS